MGTICYSTNNLRLCRYQSQSNDSRIGLVTNDNSIVDLTASGIHRMDTLLESEDPIERISKLSDKNLTKKIDNQKDVNNKNYFLIEHEEELDKWINEAEEYGEIAIDTETSSVDPHRAELIGISLSTKIGKACYIPIGHNNGSCLIKTNVIKKLKPILEDKSIKKIGQNIKFDFIVLYKQGIQMNSIEDTMLMSYVLDAGKNRHNMDLLSEIHLNHKTISFKDLVGSGKKQINLQETLCKKTVSF